MVARVLLVRLHRCAGLTLAVFLTLAGLTGSVIAFHEELDAWLNPDLFHTGHTGRALGPDELVRRVEKALPESQVTFLPLQSDIGQALPLRVESRSGKPDAPDEVFADPATGQVLGARQWGACCLGPRELLPFLYRLHYTLQVPGRWGVLFMGSIAILWSLDSVLGLLLTLPRAAPFWRNWSKGWKVKRGAGWPRLQFDVHRAGGLWSWLVLLMLAISGTAMNLPTEVFRPVVSWFSALKPSVEETGAMGIPRAPQRPLITWEQALSQARQEGRQRGWDIRLQYAFLATSQQMYCVAFKRAPAAGDWGLGPSFFYIDAGTGSLIDSDIMGTGSAGDVFIQAQYPLHSGRIAGLPGRLLISLTGMLVAVLSWTGVYLWLRKRLRGSSRRCVAARTAAARKATAP